MGGGGGYEAYKRYGAREIPASAGHAETMMGNGREVMARTEPGHGVFNSQGAGPVLITGT